jgi:signal transduction histidine kinase
MTKSATNPLSEQPSQSGHAGHSTKGGVGKRLRVLLVEDDPNDAELVVLELQRGGYEPAMWRVQTAAEMRRALAEEAWDVIVSDYSMPTFSGPEAFNVLREVGLDLPFIIVSGTVGEEVAVEAMRAGVHDFLIKGHLRRLVAAIERELREATMRAERRKIQEQLLISERMASVGTLAAGVAHEINNPLSVVAGNLLILKQDFESVVRALGALPSTERVVAAASSSFREAVADAEEATERVRLLTRDLRVFSHPDEVKREAVDVHNVLESAIRMARNELRPRATVVRRFGDVPKVQANEARLGQVFLNLLVNAAHAIPEGHREDQTITLVTGRQDEMVVVDVIDTGVGIPPEVLPRIFDIFFTTKPVGIGTGMGLAICHRILTSLGGRIEVQSRVGEGTRFRVLLQRARSGATLELPVEASKIAGPARERTASLLVVEDEPALGRVLPRLLSPHRVTVVERGAEALARILAGERFDVILCDIMMPEMTGMEFHRELSRVRPEIAARVVFMSGGVFTPGVRSFLDEIPNRRIDKPLDIDALRRLIGEALPDSDRGR